MPDERGPRALIARVAQGDQEAQRQLNQLSKAGPDATVVNITQADIEAALGPRRGPIDVTIGGLRLTVSRSISRDGVHGPARYDAVIPPQPKGRPPTVYQFGDGELRVWRSEPMEGHPAGVLTQESLVGPRRPRAGLERLSYSQGEGEFVGSPLERAHVHGAGRGVESPFGIGLAPREVNQYLQAQGIESYIGRLRDALADHPGIEILYHTDVTFHPGTSRQSKIGYGIDVVINGERIRFAEFAIHIDSDPPGTAPADRRGSRNPTVDPIEFMTTQRTDAAGRVLDQIRHKVDIPDQLFHGSRNAPDPEYQEVYRQLAASTPELIESAVGFSDNAGRIGTHRPPEGQFDTGDWHQQLLSKLSGDEVPRFLVVDVRGVHLSELQAREMRRMINALPPRMRRKVIWLENP
jgi:hypothetical protein